MFEECVATPTSPSCPGPNPNQVQVVEKLLAANDYGFMLCMPETGQTAEVIRGLMRARKTVLVASYTHSAVDTILWKVVGAPTGLLVDQ